MAATRPIFLPPREEFDADTGFVVLEGPTNMSPPLNALRRIDSMQASWGEENGGLVLDYPRSESPKAEDMADTEDRWRDSFNGSGPVARGGRTPFSRRFSAQMTSHEFSWNIYIPMLLEAEARPGRSSVLSHLVAAGVPPSQRATLWPILSGSKFAQLERPTYYAELVAQSLTERTPLSKQIETDLPRTFPEKIENSRALFGDKPPGIVQLRRVLAAYSIHNPTVGYCQGMNFVASFLLSALDEEQTFWMMVTVIEKLLPASYYSSSVKGIRAEADLFKLIVTKELPDLARHLEANSIDVALFTIDWFVSLFTVGFLPKFTLRLWDVLLYEGRVTLFCFALALMRLNESRLMEATSMEKLFAVLRSAPKRDYNLDEVVKMVDVPVMARTVKRLAFTMARSQMADAVILPSRSTVPSLLSAPLRANPPAAAAAPVTPLPLPPSASASNRRTPSAVDNRRGNAPPRGLKLDQSAEHEAAVAAQEAPAQPRGIGKLFGLKARTKKPDQQPEMLEVPESRSRASSASAGSNGGRRPLSANLSLGTSKYFS